MKKTLYYLLPFLIIFYSCNKNNNQQNVQYCEEILELQLSRIIESIAFQGKYEIDNNNTLYFYLDFYNRNDSSFLSITYDTGPPLFYFGYKSFVGFMKYKDNYIVVVNHINDSIISNFINVDLLITDSIEYKKLEGNKYLSDGSIYEYYIDKINTMHPTTNAARNVLEQN